ncbi:MAG: hypothetical protein Q7S92_02200 [Candidatus Diapherotrites archaeon]|nr:hypothetical protein [Candidatus Diapherotrites archaeon]
MTEEPIQPELKLYRALLEKYADIINEHERKTIGQLKALVNPENLSIQALLSDFLPENYSFEQDYLTVLEKVYTYLKNEVQCIKTDLNINYWMSTEEILQHQVADDEDIAVLLCACMHALGDKQAFVTIAELSNLSTHAFVLTEYKDQALLLDLFQKYEFQKFFGTKVTVLENYTFEETAIKQFMYQFNHFEYKQFL